MLLRSLTPAAAACSGRRRRSLSIAAAVAGVIAGTAAPARAEAPGLELRWPAVAGCPTRAEVEARIDRLLGEGAAARVVAAATISRGEAGYGVVLTVEGAGGSQRRALTGPRCEVLADAAAIIVAVAADPLAVAGRIALREAAGDGVVDEAARASDRAVTASDTAATARDSGATAREPGSTASDRAATASAPARPQELDAPSQDRDDEPRSAPREVEDEPLSAPGDRSLEAAAPPRRRPFAVPRPALALSLGTAAGRGPSPRFTAGLRGGLALLWTRARVDLRGSYWFPSPLRFADAPTVGADLRLGAAALRGCPRLPLGRASVDLCGGVELGALTARGVGLDDTRESRGLWAAGVVALTLEWRPLRWLALGLEVEGLAAITRRVYAVLGAPAPLYTVPPLGVRLGGGLSLIFF